MFFTAARYYQHCSFAADASAVPTPFSYHYLQILLSLYSTRYNRFRTDINKNGDSRLHALYGETGTFFLLLNCGLETAWIISSWPGYGGPPPPQPACAPVSGRHGFRRSISHPRKMTGLPRCSRYQLFIRSGSAGTPPGVIRIPVHNWSYRSANLGTCISLFMKSERIAMDVIRVSVVPGREKSSGILLPGL